MLTTSAIAAEVWTTLAAAYNAAGSMGQKLNSAASGGVDYADLAAAVWAHAEANDMQGLIASLPADLLTAAQASPIHADTQKINGAEVVGNGTEANKWRGAGV